MYQPTDGKYKYRKHTVCSEVSLKPVSVAVLVVTAPVYGESNSSCSWVCSDAAGEELFIRGGEMTSLRMTVMEKRQKKAGFVK